jgi:5-methylcytosine-specific restriction endonuclease McrA
MKFDDLYPNTGSLEQHGVMFKMPVVQTCDNCCSETSWTIFKKKDFFTEIIGDGNANFVGSCACSEECLEALKTRAKFFSKYHKGYVNSWLTKLKNLSMSHSSRSRRLGKKIERSRFNYSYGLRKVEEFLMNPECPYCKCNMKGLSLNKITFDHVQPLSKDGVHELNNIVLCCGPCNHSKDSE